MVATLYRSRKARRAALAAVLAGAIALALFPDRGSQGDEGRRSEAFDGTGTPVSGQTHGSSTIAGFGASDASRRPGSGGTREPEPPPPPPPPPCGAIAEIGLYRVVVSLIGIRCEADATLAEAREQADQGREKAEEMTSDAQELPDRVQITPPSYTKGEDPSVTEPKVGGEKPSATYDGQTLTVDRGDPTVTGPEADPGEPGTVDPGSVETE